MWEIPWIEIQRMLIDAPSYESGKSGSKSAGSKTKTFSHDALAQELLKTYSNIPR